MKVYELLNELKEIAESSSKVPLTGKSLVDSEDILEIVNEIINELPNELQRAQWITDEKNRLISEAENERQIILEEAKVKADEMVDQHEITNRARIKAQEILDRADMQCTNLKMGTYEYLDNVMNSMLERVDQISNVYMHDMFENMKKNFDSVTETLSDNKAELKNLAYQESIKGKAIDKVDEDFNLIEGDVE